MGENGGSEVDDERMREMLDQDDKDARETHELRDALAQQLFKLADDLPAVFEGEWSPTAQARGSEDCDRRLDLGDGITTVFDLVQHETRLLVRASGDHLSGLATLIEVEETALAPITLSRTAYETSLRAQSLIDVRHDWRVRTQRALSRRLARLHVDRREQDYFGKDDAEPEEDDLDDDRLDIDGQEQRVRDFADARGWPVDEGRPYEPPVIGKREGIRDLAKGLFDDDLGAFFWRATSEVGHGNVSLDIADWLDIFRDHLGGSASIWWLAQKTVHAVAAPVALLDSFQQYASHDVDAYSRALVCRQLWLYAGNMRRH